MTQMLLIHLNSFNGQTYPIDFTQCQVAFGSTCFVQFDLFQSISLIGKKSIRLSKAYFLSNNSNIQLPIDLLFNSQTRDFDALSNQQELSLHNSVIKLNMSFSPSILTVLDSLVTDLNSSETYEPRKSSSSTLPSTDDGIINSKTSSSIKESIVFKNPPINQNDLAFSVSPYILKSCLLPGDLNPDVKVVAEDHPNDIVKSNLQSLVMNFNVGLVLDLEQKILVSSNINWLRCIEGVSFKVLIYSFYTFPSSSE